MPDSPAGAILSDIQILERLVAPDDECIFVSPLIAPALQIGPSSLDLHLGGGLRSTRITGTTHVDLTAGTDEIRRQLSDYIETKTAGPDEKLVLHPGEFALGSTVEFIRLPRDIAGRLEGRSSVGRMGLQVHATAGFVDPGFEGRLTFELINGGSLPLTLKPGIRIAQISFYPITDAQAPYEGKYGGELGAEGSRIYEDPELGSRRDTMRGGGVPT